VPRFRASLAPGEIKNAELVARRGVCRGHFEAAPQLDGLNLAALYLGRDAPHDQAGAQHSQSPMDAEVRAVMTKYAMSDTRHKAKSWANGP